MGRPTQAELEELLNASYRYALSLTGREADAEDLVHEGWMRLHRRARSEPTKALLFTVIRNLHIDQVRRRQRFRHEELDEAELPCDSQDPTALVEKREIETALGGLRSREREAIYLNFVEGYTAAEIAETMACPRGTVLSLIHRGKEKLARALCDDVVREKG